MLHKQRCTQAVSRLLYLRPPECQPEVLECDERSSEAVVDLGGVSEVLQVGHGFDVSKDHHRVLDTLEELPRPLDGTGDRWSIPDEWWVILWGVKDWSGVQCGPNFEHVSSNYAKQKSN